MADSFQVLQQKILNHSYFKKTKNIIENNSCHPNESVYDHLLATAKRAEEGVHGEFITNEKTKIFFKNWMNKKLFDMPYKEIAILVALLHDIGKILVYEESGKQVSLIVIKNDHTTSAVGHEYWRSTIVPAILTNVGLSVDLTDYISQIVRLHGILMFPLFDKSKTLEDHISYMKALGQGFEKEILFNMYVDVTTCPLFQEWLQIIIQMFNSETLYKKREYRVL